MTNNFTIGDLEVLVVSDGDARAPATVYFPGSSTEQWEPHKRWLDHEGNSLSFPEHGSLAMAPEDTRWVGQQLPKGLERRRGEHAIQQAVHRHGVTAESVGTKIPAGAVPTVAREL